MSKEQEIINNKIQESNDLNNKIKELYSLAEQKFGRRLKYPSICITEESVKNKAKNCLYLLHKHLNKEDLVTKKIVSLIAKQLYGPKLPSYRRREVKIKLGIKVGIRGIEKYKNIDWENRSLQNIADELNVSRQRVYQIWQALQTQK